MTSIADLVVTLRADMAGYASSMAEGARLIQTVETSASQASAQLERLAKAYAMPQSAQSLNRNEAAMLQSVAMKKEETEKSLLRQRLQRMEVEATAAWNMSQRKVTASLNEYQQRVGLEDRLFALTHSQREVDIANLQSYYGRIRMLHAGNAKMQSLVDKTQAAEMMALNEQTGGGFLGTIGGKRMFKRQFKYAAATALGIHGGEVGMAAAAAGTMQGAAMGVMAGMLIVGGTYQALNNQAAKLTAMQEKYADAVRDSARWMEKLVAVQTTSTGSEFRSRIDALRDQAKDIEKESKKGAKELGVLDTAGALFQAIYRGGMAQTDLVKGVMQELAVYKMLQAEAKKIRDWAYEEETAQREITKQTRESAIERARLSAMVGGDEKSRLEMMYSQAEERRRLDDEQKERMRNLMRDTAPGAEDRVRGEAARQAVERLDTMQKQVYERQGLEREIAARKREEEIKREVEEYKKQLEVIGMSRDLTTRLLEAQGGSKLDAMLDKQRRELVLRSASNDEIERQLNLLKSIYQLEADKPLVDEMEKLDLELTIVTGRFREMEAAVARLGQANKEASRAKIEELAALQGRLNLAKWAKEQTDSLKTPLEQFREYQEKIENSVMEGLMTRKQADSLLQKRVKEQMDQLMPKETHNVESRGTFSAYELATGAMGAGSVQDRIADATGETAKNTGKMIRLMDALGVTFN